MLEWMELVQRVDDLNEAGSFDEVLDALSDFTPSQLTEAPELGVNYAWALYFTHRWERDRMLSFVEQMRLFCLRRPSPTLLLRLDLLLGTLLFHRGELDAAEELYRLVVLRSSEVGFVRGEVGAWTGLGMIADLRGNLDEALACYDRCVPVLPFVSLAVQRGAVHYSRGVVLLHAGRPLDAQDAFRRAAGIAAAAEMPGIWATVVIALALATSDVGDQAVARAITERLLSLPVGSELTGHQRAAASRVMGLIAVRQGRLSEAESLLAGGLAEARACGDRLLVAEILEVQGELADRRDDVVEARACYLTAEMVYRELSSAWRAAQVRRLADVLL